MRGRAENRAGRRNSCWGVNLRSRWFFATIMKAASSDNPEEAAFAMLRGMRLRLQHAAAPGEVGFVISAAQGTDDDLARRGRSMHKLPVAQVNAGVVAQVAIAHGVEAHDIAALQVADAFDLGTVLIALRLRGAGERYANLLVSVVHQAGAVNAHGGLAPPAVMGAGVEQS